MTQPTEVLLLGPGPSPVAPRVMHAMTAPVLSHLDPAMMTILDNIRARLAGVFKAGDGSLFEARWERHRVNHLALVDALGALGLELLPPPAERLWSLNAVSVPVGVDEARVRKRLLDEHGIEIGAGLGPLAGKIWRVGLMGSGSTKDNITRLTGALKTLLA